MPKQTKSYDDSKSRNLVADYFEKMGYIIFEPDYETYKVGDLVLIDKETGEWFVVEVEQMYSRSLKYIDQLIELAKGEREGGEYGGGFSIVPRKFEYLDEDRKVSNRIKKDLTEAGLVVPPTDIKWRMYCRISPRKDGMFVALREDVEGHIEGQVNTDNNSYKEKRRAVPWEKVDYVPLT